MKDSYSIILAPNPSLLTGPGTNTIVLGDRATGALVIDPAVDDSEYLSTLIQEGQIRGGIQRILISHCHSDHTGGAVALRDRLQVPILAFSRKGVPFADEEIADNAVFPIGDDVLRALHTPGHSFDHLCFWLEKQQILFAGDLIASSGTVVIPPPPAGDLQDYMHSLQYVQNLALGKIIPAHGEAITRPQGKLAEYIAHRQKREQQIITVMRGAPQELAIETIVHEIYQDIGAELYPFATQSVLSHLLKLERERKVKCMDNQQDRWMLT